RFHFFFFQAEDGIRAFHVTGVQTCALPISTKYPRLAAELKAYAEGARADLMEAVEARKQGEPAGEGSEGATLYDLSLTFTELVDTPELAAYAADGSMYTGGAHGMPLMERFVWLPQAQQRLTAQELV